MIDETEGMPSSSTYRHRFGTLDSAYRLIGFDPCRDNRYIEINRHLRRLYPEIVEGAIRRIKEFA
jgi:hypothetical protein